MRKKDGARNVSKTIHADARRGRRANRSGFERTNAVPSFHRGERRARDVEGTEQGRRTRDNEQQRPVSMQRLSEEALRRHAAQMREQRERAARMKNALKKEMDDFVQTGPKHDLHTPLHNACEDGDVQTVEALLKMGADVNECDEAGVSALATAASWGQVDVCRLLLANGANVMKADKLGDTALHEAARADELDVAEVLCEAPGMDVNVKNKHGCTALHVASHAGKGVMVKLLIRLGASVNGPKGEMKGGYSALHVAAANGSSSSLSALLEGGANIRHSASESTIHRSASGTALELAEANDHKEAAQLLRNASQREFEKNGLFGPE